MKPACIPQGITVRLRLGAAQTLQRRSGNNPEIEGTPKNCFFGVQCQFY
jgi:hypothetical protein